MYIFNFNCIRDWESEGGIPNAYLFCLHFHSELHPWSSNWKRIDIINPSHSCLTRFPFFTSYPAATPTKEKNLWLRIYFQLSLDFWICLDAFCLKKMQPSDTSGGGSKAWIICRIAASCSTASNLGQLKSLGSWSWTGLRWRQVVTKKRRKKNDTKH